MASIMQGTTPSVTITIDPDDFQLAKRWICLMG
jgi:hypothetical protein